MKRRLFAIILSAVLALTLTSSFIVVAMKLGKYHLTDIYIGTLWSFAILLIFFLSISSKLEWLLQKETY